MLCASHGRGEQSPNPPTTGPATPGRLWETLVVTGEQRFELTEGVALRAYAKMINTLSAEPLESILADDFTYESQTVFQALESRHAFLEYIIPKLETIRRSNAKVFAEMGTVLAYGKSQPCVILAQNDKANLVALVLAKTHGGKLSRLDLCIAPPPQAAERSGEYPT